MANDVTILWLFLTLFVALGFVMPFINSTYNTSYAEVNGESLIEGVDVSKVDDVSSFQIIASIISSFFWGTEFPAILNILFIPIRLAFAFLIARNIWVGGGA